MASKRTTRPILVAPGLVVLGLIVAAAAGSVLALSAFGDSGPEPPLGVRRRATEEARSMIARDDAAAAPAPPAGSRVAAGEPSSALDAVAEPAPPPGVVRGRVVDSDGNGVQAQLAFEREPLGGKRYRGYSAESLPDGSFVLSIPERPDEPDLDVVRGALFVEAEGVGTSALQDIEWRREALPQDLVLTARGPGVVEGRVRDGDGRPCPALPLGIRHVGAFARGEGGRPDGSWFRAHSRLEEDGFTVHHCVTDGAGRFRATGLREGRYRVFVETDGFPAWILDEGPPELTVTAHGTGEGPLELRYDAPRIEVRLLDAAGEPWTGPVDVERGGLSASPFTPPAGSAVVRAFPARPFAGRIVPETTDPADTLSTTGRSEGVVRYRARADRDYLVAVSGGAGGQHFAPEPVPVRIEPGESLAAVTLRAAPDVELGVARLDVAVRHWRTEWASGPDGFRQRDAFTEPGPLHWLASSSTLVMEDADTGTPVAYPAAVEGEIHEARLPAGTYVARVGWRPRDRSRDELVFGDPHGGATRSFEITPGETVDVRIEVGPGARVEVENRTQLVAELALVDAEGRRRLLLRLDGSNSKRWVRAVNTYPGGRTLRSEPVPAGAWRLVGTLGPRTVDRPLELRDERTTRVVLE